MLLVFRDPRYHQWETLENIQVSARFGVLSDIFEQSQHQSSSVNIFFRQHFLNEYKDKRDRAGTCALCSSLVKHFILQRVDRRPEETAEH